VRVGANGRLLSDHVENLSSIRLVGHQPTAVLRRRRADANAPFLARAKDSASS
jgi:hypothetical protein